MLDGSESSIRELSLSLIVEMLKNQVFCRLSNLFWSISLLAIDERGYPFLFTISFYFIYFLLFQRDAMEDSVEVVIEKLLNVTKDVSPKVNSHLDEVIMLKIFFPFFLMWCYICPGFK